MLRQRPSSGGAIPRSSLTSSSSSPGISHHGGGASTPSPQLYYSPRHQPQQRPDWMSLQDIPDECNDGAEGSEDGANAQGTIWDGNRKLFVQLLDDMDNIGQVPGVSEGSARRRRKARELFTDWLFNRKTPEVKPSAVSPFIARNSDNRRFSGDFTDFDVKSPVGGFPVNHRPLPGRLERQAPSRRSCGLIGDVQRRNLPQVKARPCSINLSTEQDEADSGYHSGNSAVLNGAFKKVQGPGELTLTREDLKRRIEKFNATNTHGLLMEMPMDRSMTFQGFIRVHMNLIRPISIRLSTRPLTIYDTLKKRGKGERSEVQQVERSEGHQGEAIDESMMSFRLPKNTSKVIHITSMTTTVEVINVLLSKFNISDSPRKFSLYERIELPDSKPTMRRMSEDEHPLMMCLSWTDDAVENLDYNKFVLQENDCGEIMWEAFSLPELESFLIVLDREERECIQQVVDKFGFLKLHMERRISEMSVGPRKEGRTEKKKKAPLFV